jgi:hypothetical protein
MKSIKTVWSFISKQIADVNDAILHELCVFRVISVEKDRYAWAVGEGKSESFGSVQSRGRLHNQTASMQCTTAGTESITSAGDSAPAARPTVTASGLAAVARPTATASGLAALARPTSTASGLAALAKPTVTASGLAALSKSTSTTTELAAAEGATAKTAGRKRISDISQLRLDAYVARTQEQAIKQTSAGEGIV